MDSRREKIMNETTNERFMKPKSSPCWLCSHVFKSENYDTHDLYLTLDEDNSFWINSECDYSGQNECFEIYYCPMCGAELKAENYKFGDD